MNSTDIFCTALNLPDPWFVSHVEFKPSATAQLELHIDIDFKRGSVFTVQAKNGSYQGKAYDTIEKTWRHLNFFQYRTYLHARVPRIMGPDGKEIHLVEVPWSRPSSGFTLLFEAVVLELCKHMPVRQVAEQMQEVDTRLWRVIFHYIDAARAVADYSGTVALGMDETSKKGHNYITVFADLETRKVLYVASGKDKKTVEDFAADFALHHGNADKIKVITCDMSLGFLAAIKETFINGKSVIDKFHVIKHMNDAVDRVRKAEVRANPILRGTKYLWLKNADKLTEPQKSKFEKLSQMRLKTGRAHAMRVALQEIFESCANKEMAKEKLLELYDWLIRSQLAPMLEFAKTLKRHLTEILNYWDFPYTNATLEGLNSIIQNAKCQARGFRNDEYFKAIIYLVAGQINLDEVCPRVSAKVTHSI